MWTTSLIASMLPVGAVVDRSSRATAVSAADAQDGEGRVEHLPVDACDGEVAEQRSDVAVDAALVALARRPVDVDDLCSGS